MITQQQYNEHNSLLQIQMGLMTSESLVVRQRYNEEVYEREWEWCAQACKANRELDPSFHDFQLELIEEQERATNALLERNECK